MKKNIVLTALVLNVVFLVLFMLFLFGSLKENSPPRKKLRSSLDKADNSYIKSSRAVLKITSKPSEAKIFVNGYYKGMTPGEVIISTVTKSAKEYRIKVIKTGYIPWEKKVKLVRGDRKRFRVILKSKGY